MVVLNALHSRIHPIKRGLSKAVKHVLKSKEYWGPCLNPDRDYCTNSLEFIRNISSWSQDILHRAGAGKKQICVFNDSIVTDKDQI